MKTEITSNALSLKETQAILAAIALGLILVVATNFAPISAAHNAAHDTRHSLGFPCH